MSERGSFVTEYIYCDRCFEAAREVLERDHKYFKGTPVPIWSGGGGRYLPIVAGKVGGLYEGEELHMFEDELNEQLAAKICHPLRIAVISEHEDRLYEIEPEVQQPHQ